MKNILEVEQEVTDHLIEKFRTAYVERLTSISNLSESEQVQAKEFSNMFSDLTSSLDIMNPMMYDIKTILLAVMACTIKGLKYLNSLGETVSSFMMPTELDLELSKKIVENLKNGSSIVNMKDFLKSIIEQKPKVQEGLTNVLDENGNRMTIEQLEENFNKSN